MFEEKQSLEKTIFREADRYEASDSRGAYCRGGDFVVKTYLIPERAQLADAVLKLEEAISVIRRLGLQCVNTGNYGALGLSPGECTCSTCDAKAFLKKVGRPV